MNTKTTTKKNQIKEFLSDKILFFTDLHIGLRGDSEDRLKVALEFSDWLKNVAIENKIKTIVFLGDFFHDREEIRLTALDTANRFLDNLKDFNLILLVGNHDCFYKDNTIINSLSVFQKWKNIVVVDNLEIIEYQDKTIALMPWGAKLEDVPNGIDYIFGHLEINSFFMNRVKMCENGIQTTTLFEKAKSIFSGHFHLRSKKKYSDGTITYVGCPFQQDWGDFDEEKGVEILNLITGETSFIKNDVSPRYVKIHLSKIMEKDENEMQLIKTGLKNNIVKLIVDMDIQPEKLISISEKLSKYSPFEFNSEFLTESATQNADDFTSVEIDLKLLLIEFINNLDIKENKDKILEETLEIYNKAQLKVKNDDD